MTIIKAVGIVGCAIMLAATAQAADAPDLIRLKNGGMVRGTILDLTPNDKVEIQTSSGEKRVYKMSEVDFAGPSQQPPQPEPTGTPQSPAAAAPVVPAPTPAIAGHISPQAEAPKLTLQVTSNEPGLGLHERIVTSVAVIGNWGSGWGPSARGAGYRDLCRTPCSLSLSPGSYTLALSKESGGPIEGKPVSILPQSRELQATLVSRSGTRVAGWVIAVGGGAVGLAMILAPLTSRSSDPSAVASGFNVGLVLAGSLVTMASGVVGYFLTQVSDGAEFAAR